MVCLVKVHAHTCYQHFLPDGKLPHGLLTQSILMTPMQDSQQLKLANGNEVIIWWKQLKETMDLECYKFLKCAFQLMSGLFSAFVY